jgi:hypothetical protein
VRQACIALDEERYRPDFSIEETPTRRAADAGSGWLQRRNGSATNDNRQAAEKMFACNMSAG